MLLDLSELIKKYNLKITGVIHCGAHTGEEFPTYVKHGIRPIVFIEPCKRAFANLISLFGNNGDVQLYNVACGEGESQMEMYTGDNTVNKGQSNSLLRPVKHLDIHPTVEFTDKETVSVVPMDKLRLFEGYNFLVMDCQGFEGRVVRGATETLKSVDYIYSEVNKDTVYEDCTLVDELDSLLHEFERVETGAWVGGMWSDALYIRKTLLNQQ